MKRAAPPTTKERLAALRERLPACKFESRDGGNLTIWISGVGIEPWVAQLCPRPNGLWLVMTRQGGWHGDGRSPALPQIWDRAITMVARHVQRELARRVSKAESEASRLAGLLEKMDALDTRKVREGLEKG